VAENIGVIYQSHYGTTRQYAAWIAEELGAELMDRREVAPVALQKFDCVIYGGGLYAGGIIGADLAAKNSCKKLIVFTVGLADPEITDYTAILRKNFPAGSYQPSKVFHLRGGIDYKKLNFVHRVMMAALKKMIDLKPASRRNEEEHEFVRTYGNAVDFTDRKTIIPLVSYIREITKNRDTEVGPGNVPSASDE
jgi:menaquinone-dependent protoporphyrinogen IX oxidase